MEGRRTLETGKFNITSGYHNLLLIDCKMNPVAYFTCLVYPGLRQRWVITSTVFRNV